MFFEKKHYTFAVVVYNQVNAKPENSILAKNIEALSQNSREIIGDVDIIARSHEVHYTLVNHGGEYTFKAEVDLCPYPVNIGGEAKCPRTSITVDFDCCIFVQAPTNGCEVYPTSCSSILEYYGVD